MTRRTWMRTAGAAMLAPAVFAKKSALKIGVTDWNLKLTGKLEAVALARSLGFDGVQVSLGRTPVNDKLPLDDAAVQAQYLEASQKEGIPIDGTCLDILHVNYLKNDKLGQRWVADSIRITKALKTK